jgi:ADP-ribose pyrophosphatase YjhB (NUDIX family)
MELVRQVAALPVRRNPDGSLSVLLVTSRETRRWVIPKGWPWPDREDHLAAAEEAREEVGVLSLALAESIGSYTYRKGHPAGPIAVRVYVYLLEVREELVNWPERDQRERAWFELPDAMSKVDEPELRDLLRQAGERDGLQDDGISRQHSTRGKCQRCRRRSVGAVTFSQNMRSISPATPADIGKAL